MSPTTPTPKRARSSREPWQAPRDRKQLVKAIGAAAIVVVLSIGAVLFLGREYLGDDATPVTPVPTAPVPTAPVDTTPTTPTTPVTPDTAPATGSSTPAGETLTPPAS